MGRWFEGRWRRKREEEEQKRRSKKEWEKRRNTNPFPKNTQKTKGGDLFFLE